MVPFCPESRLSGIGRHMGDSLWYRRRFFAPECDRLHLHFGAVDYRATVWVNGAEVARHEGGHTPFSADVTPAALRGENELVLHAEDALRDRTIPRGKQHWSEAGEGIFYTPTTGIWQTVWLEPLAERHLSRLSLRPNLDAGCVDFEVEGDGRVEVAARLEGTVVGRAVSEEGAGRLMLERVEAWSPEQPWLYDLEIRLLDPAGRALDHVRSYFGLRTVEARDGRFWLNGEPYFQKLVLDQGYFRGGLLTAPADADLKRDVELAKALGFNGARKHQKIEDPRWLYWADVLGFLVWEEMPAFHEHSPDAERRLSGEWAQAVRRDRDHPCVVVWVPFNESSGLEQLDTNVRAGVLTRLYRLTRRLDATRPVVSNDGWEHALTDVCTVHDYGSPEALARRFRDLKSALDPGLAPRPVYLPGFEYRGEPLIVSEIGGLKLAGSGGWGYEEVREPDELVGRYAALLRALTGAGTVQGYCYTQLTDVEQERNGLLTFDRKPKVEPGLIRALNREIAKPREKPNNGPYLSH